MIEMFDYLNCKDRAQRKGLNPTTLNNAAVHQGIFEGRRYLDWQKEMQISEQRDAILPFPTVARN